MAATRQSREPAPFLARPPGIQHFIRARALTMTERQRRIPELASLDAMRVVVGGAGSLGAPLPLELAKAGVGVVDTSNRVRRARAVR